MAQRRRFDCASKNRPPKKLPMPMSSSSTTLVLSTLMLLLLSHLGGAAAAGAAAAAAAASSASISAAPVVAPAPPAAASTGPATAGSGSSGNPVSALFGFVKDQMVRMKDGSVELYTNHKKCQDIRSRQSLYAEKMGEKRMPNTGGITYSDFDFLQRGKDDRGKLGSLLFMMFFAPNFLPYAIMFNPGMMPSPFKVPPKGGMVEETRWEAISRDRTHTVIKTMLDVERSARVAPSLAKMNPFGGAKTRRTMAKMDNLIALGGTILSVPSGGPFDGGNVVLDALSDEIYTPDVPDKKRTQLVTVPKPIMAGLARVLESDSPPSNFMPNFLLRGQVVNRLQKVAAADDFLVKQSVDLSTIETNLLEEACAARLIGVPGRSSVDEMRTGLARWLDLVVVQPEKERVAKSMHYNGNLARAALVCYNAVDGARDGSASSYLPRLLFQGQQGGGQNVAEGKKKKGGSKRNL